MSEQAEHKNFWEQIKKLREARVPKMKQSDLSTAVGISQAAISKIEKGKYTPSIDVADKMAEALGFKDTREFVHRLVEMANEEDYTRYDPNKDTHVLEGLQYKRRKGRHVNFSAKPIVAGKQRRQIPLYSRNHNPRGFRFDDGILISEESATYIEAPFYLDNVDGAYAVTVNGHENSPRFYSGETLFVNPDLWPVRGDDVVIQLEYNEHTICIVREVTDMERMYDLDKDEKDPEAEHEMYGVASIASLVQQGFELNNRGQLKVDEDGDPVFSSFQGADYIHNGRKVSLHEYWVELGSVKDSELNNGLKAINMHVVVGTMRNRGNY